MKWQKSSSLVLLVLLFLFGCAKAPPSDVVTDTSTLFTGRNPIGAGSYYPGDAQTLSAIVDQMLEDAKVSDKEGRVQMIMAPHGAFVFAGPVLADAYNQVANDYRRVFIISQSKDEFPGIQMPQADYGTPLGIVKVDKSVYENLKNSSLYTIGTDSDVKIETQLPFLQRRLGEFELVPIVVGVLSPAGMNELSRLIQENSDNETLIVIASGLSKGYSYTDTYKRDTPCLSALNQANINGLLKCSFTSYIPVLSMASAAKALELEPDIVTYKTSGDTAGSKDKVEGYLALVYRRP